MKEVERLRIALFVVSMTLIAVSAVLAAVLAAKSAHRTPPRPAPAAFCPAGQYVESISASGWPVCVPIH